MHVRRLDDVAIEIYDKTPVKIAVGAIERVGERGGERERERKRERACLGGSLVFVSHRYKYHRATKQITNTVGGKPTAEISQDSGDE